MIHCVPALQLQEKQSRILRLLHVEHVLYVKIVPGKDTFACVFEASSEWKTRDSGVVGERAVSGVQRDQLGLGIESHVRVHLDHGSRSEKYKARAQNSTPFVSFFDQKECRRLPKEHRRRRLVSTDDQVRIDVAVEVETTGYRKSKGLHWTLQVLGVDHLGILVQHAGARAVVDVDGAAAVRATVGRADDEVTVTVTVDVPQGGQRQAETSAIALAVSGHTINLYRRGSTNARARS